jgi:elongation factor P
MATTNDLKNGMVLNLDGQLWSVIWFQHHKPGKGGAVVRTKLKSIESGKTVDKTFNADVKVEVANVDKRTMQYLYNDGSNYVFMDTSTYDQIEVTPDIVGDAKNFLLENQDAIVATNDGRVLYIELPASVELTIEYTEPGLQGDRSTGGTKPARLETGHEISVPLFITTGEKIRSTPGTAATWVASPSDGQRDRQRLMAARSKARKRALDILFECEVRGTPLGETLDERVVAGEPPVNEYTVRLIRGIVDHQARIDELIATYSQGWSLARMPAVDRNVLRLGVLELLYVDEVPDAVAVSEAMSLVRDLSTDESPSFVNGVLGNILRDKPALSA